MEIPDMILKALKEASIDSFGTILTTLNNINFHIANSMNEHELHIFTEIEKQIKKIECVYKAYVLGVVSNDKSMRIESMKNIKAVTTAMPSYLKDFRKVRDSHKKNCDKHKKCDKKDK